MRACEFICEGTDILYHSTSIDVARFILKSGKFDLSNNVAGSREERLAVKNKSYFLSLARSSANSYAMNDVSTYSAVTFNLDGRMLNQNFIIKPVDYYGRPYLDPHQPRFGEMEDRLHSDKPEIGISSITAAHILINGNDDDMKQTMSVLRDIIKYSKLNDIKFYVYDKLNYWGTQNKAKALTIDTIFKMIKKNSVGITDYAKVSLEKGWEGHHASHDPEKSVKDLKKLKAWMSGYRNDTVPALLTDDAADVADFVKILRTSAKPGNSNRNIALKLLTIIKQKFNNNPKIFAQYVLSKSELSETTTAGAIATVVGGMAPAITRNASIYGEPEVTTKVKKKKKKKSYE